MGKTAGFETFKGLLGLFIGGLSVAYGVPGDAQSGTEVPTLLRKVAPFAKPSPVITERIAVENKPPHDYVRPAVSQSLGFICYKF
jgi:hypothetical protein